MCLMVLCAPHAARARRLLTSRTRDEVMVKTAFDALVNSSDGGFTHIQLAPLSRTDVSSQ